MIVMLVLLIRLCVVWQWLIILKYDKWWDFFYFNHQCMQVVWINWINPQYKEKSENGDEFMNKIMFGNLNNRILIFTSIVMNQ